MNFELRSNSFTLGRIQTSLVLHLLNHEFLTVLDDDTLIALLHLLAGQIVGLAAVLLGGIHLADAGGVFGTKRDNT